MSFRKLFSLPLLLLVASACSSPSDGNNASPPPQVEVTSSSARAFAASISPWRGAIEEARNNTQIHIFRVPRPTTRPSLATDARAIEAATLGALEGADKVGRDNLLVLLAEVAEESGSDRLASLLGRTEDPSDAVPIMRALETIYGLPAFYEPHSMGCGTGSGDAEVDRLAAERWEADERRRFGEGRTALLSWLATNASRPRAERVNAALTAWDQRDWVSQPSQSVEGIDFDRVLRFQTVLRLGEDALPGLRSRKSAAADDVAAAHYEVLIAAISGELDEPLVRRLLAQYDHLALVAATEIIAAAGDKRWTKELDALQSSRMEEAAHAASKALVSVLGRDALPLLQAAAAKTPDNYTAKYAALAILESK